ncbi:MAG: Capsular polysaccharide biosynthesis protein WcbQ [uncultured Thiotrichaceae bacterium]|uniref:Capsular polysaccharide biosynthesis protein WcbQ n=1 Tax=uncultured Thiotrichaceae bacterium TaxID=298394 RepID=A0A6S6SDD6_9GAMM|nr:MAG: Capsular polysaccharide biosynthesis protein WcbQ [uncultured Thiotrichaceae bacterium]
MSMILSGLTASVCYVMSNQHGQTSNCSLKAIVLVFALAMCIYSVCLLTFQRPVFALITSLCLLGVVLIVNKTKMNTLREPLVASDLLMYAQVFRFPRLYLPFLNITSMIVLAIALPVIIGVALYVEERQDIHYPVIILLVLTSGAVFFWMAKSLKISSDITKDYPRLGLLACLAAYFVQSFAVTNRQNFEDILANNVLPVGADDAELADIVVIQSESFFDVRRLTHDIRWDILETYDEFCTEAHHTGKLNVPAWGANTLRTEFSFLSGMKNRDLGLYRYYPYFFMQQPNILTLPKLLQEKGYKTICIHPYEKDFFGRHQVFETLGFDEFIDIQHFHDADRFGPYVSDASVANKITALLESSDQPTFVFAITMENHGPLYLEDIEESEIEALTSKTAGKIDRDLAIYTRHIENTDAMLKQLKAYFTRTKKPALLGFYGDHLPALSGCFDAYGFTSNDSDYFIWSNYIEAQSEKCDCAIEQLPSFIVELVNSAKKMA